MTFNGHGLFSVFAMLICASSLRGLEGVAKMCSGLDDFVNNTNENITLCRRDDKCTMVTCTVQDPTISQVILNSQTTFLPCTSPPAISISFLRPNGSLFSFHLVNRTTEVFLLATPILVEDFMVTLHISLLINVSHTPNCLQIETNIIQQVPGITEFHSSASLSDLTTIMIDPVLCSSPPLEVSSALPTMAIGNETEAVDETFSVGITSSSPAPSSSIAAALTASLFIIQCICSTFWIQR